MGKLVHFVDLKDKRDSSEGFRAPNGKYFSSEIAYRKWEKQKTYRNDCIDKLMEILEYEPGMKPNTYLFKYLQELEVYGFDVVYDTILDKEYALRRALYTKTFTAEQPMIAYIMSIITNHLKEVYDDKNAAQARKRKSAEIIEIEDFVPQKQKTKDISRWLNDEGD